MLDTSQLLLLTFSFAPSPLGMGVWFEEDQVRTELTDWEGVTDLSPSSVRKVSARF